MVPLVETVTLATRETHQVQAELREAESVVAESESSLTKLDLAPMLREKGVTDIAEIDFVIFRTRRIDFSHPGYRS